MVKVVLQIEYQSVMTRSMTVRESPVIQEQKENRKYTTNSKQSSKRMADH